MTTDQVQRSNHGVDRTDQRSVDGAKAASELRYWVGRREQEGRLSNRHYEHFYTAHFGLDRGFYTGKRILDIGCGPRGSLEWASMAAERVGLDLLAEEYRALGTDDHTMDYVAAPAERIPFPDGHFDVVCAFNALDHVDDLASVIEEITRVTAPGGLFLLLTDIHDEPTTNEPQTFSWEIVEEFRRNFTVLAEQHFEKPSGGMYESILAAVPFDHANRRRRYGVLSAMFAKALPGASC